MVFGSITLTDLPNDSFSHTLSCKDGSYNLIIFIDIYSLCMFITYFLEKSLNASLSLFVSLVGG